MPALREMVFHWPKDTGPLVGINKVNQLFDNLISYGRLIGLWHYKSNSNVTKDQILDNLNNGEVYCEPLAWAFRSLVEEACGKGAFAFEKIDLGSCLTRRGLPCIDRDVVGNIRYTNTTYKQTNQAFYTKHVYMKVGQNFYDPTTATVYKTKKEPVVYEGWFSVDDLRMARQNPMVILKVLPEEHPSGFECGFLALKPTDLSKTEKKKLKKALKESITMQDQYQVLDKLKIW